MHLLLVFYSVWTLICYKAIRSQSQRQPLEWINRWRIFAAVDLVNIEGVNCLWNILRQAITLAIHILLLISKILTEIRNYTFSEKCICIRRLNIFRSIFSDAHEDNMFQCRVAILGLYSLSVRTPYRRSLEFSKPRDSGLDFSNRSNRHIGMPVKFQRDMNINEYYNIQYLSFEASWSLASG